MIENNKIKEKTKNDITYRYDKTLKELLDNKTLMKQLITGFINEDWVKDIDFRTLKKEKTDFLSEDLKEFRKDLLWSVKLKGEKLYFYIHIEFQSIPDRNMPFRFLIYDSLLHIDILKNRNKKDKSQKLPFILPILFYIGDDDWNFEFDLTKLIAQPFKNAINYIPKFDIFKIMLNQKSLKDLRKVDSLLSNILATDNKEINKKDLDEITEKIKNILSEYNEEKKIIMLDKVNKFFKLISSDKIDMTIAIKTLNKEDKMGGFMNLLKKEREQGIEQGIEQGKLNEKIETAKEMLELGSNVAFISKVTKLSIEKIQEIQEGMRNK